MSSEPIIPVIQRYSLTGVYVQNAGNPDLQIRLKEYQGLRDNIF